MSSACGKRAKVYPFYIFARDYQSESEAEEAEGQVTVMQQLQQQDHSQVQPSAVKLTEVWVKIKKKTHTFIQSQHFPPPIFFFLLPILFFVVLLCLLNFLLLASWVPE